MTRSGLRVVWGVVVVAASVAAGPTSAQSLNEALANTYRSNPTLNAARAQLRITNEGVPVALAGMRPTASWSADVAASTARNESIPNAAGVSTRTTSATTPRGHSLTVNQTLFNGWQTENNVRRAEAQVGAAREVLRTSEQDVLLAAVTAYMDVVQATAIVDLQRGNVGVLTELLRATQNRFQVGEVTRTDVAQAEARLALARANLAAANATVTTARAAFRRVIGRDPGRLTGATTVQRLLPRDVDRALAVGSSEHPQIRAAVYNVDAAAFAIRVAEATLLPNVALQGTLSQRFQSVVNVNESQSAQVLARVTVPIFDGGAAAAATRQAKETMAQTRINVDSVRDLIRANIVGTWGNVEQLRAQIVASTAQIEAATIALNGVREEARVGQRHHARRAQRAAGPAQRPGRARSERAQQRGRDVHAPRRRRPAQRPHPRPRGRHLRPRDALPAGARPLARPAHAEWGLTLRRASPGLSPVDGLVHDRIPRIGESCDSAGSWMRTRR